MKTGASSLILVIIILISACQQTKRSVLAEQRPKEIFTPAEHNYSGFQIYLNYDLLPEDVSLVFFDSRIKSATGMFFQEMHIIKNTDLYLCNNVIAIDILECLMDNISISRVISHELAHYRQYKYSKDLDEFVKAYNTNPEIFEEEAYEAESDSPVLAKIGDNKEADWARIALVTGFTEHNITYKKQK